MSIASACGGGLEPPRTVALITIDTLRADYVHAYGFAQPTTPNLDAIASRGVLFERAIAVSPSTIPSHASMMTGRYPRQQSTGARNGDTRLEGVPTLADQFASDGWATAAFVSNVVLQRRSGLDRGFQHYDQRLPAGETNRLAPERLADDTVDAALSWLTDQDDHRVFLWVHLQDPHGPYTPPPGWLERVETPPLPADPRLERAKIDGPADAIPGYQYIEGLQHPSEYARRYAAEIAYVDSALARLVEALEQRGPLALVLTADHGESLGEAGRYLQHGHATTPELARVPFLLMAPGVDPARPGGLVSHVDIAPTLLEIAGLPGIPGSPGLALGGLLRAGQALPDRTVFCDAVGESSAYRRRSYVRFGGFGGSENKTAAQAIAQLDAGDSAAVRVLATREGADGTWQPGLDPELARELKASLRAEAPLAPAVIDAPTLSRLRQLGYLSEFGELNELGDPGDPRKARDAPPSEADAPERP